MNNLILTILCSTTIAVILKINGNSRGNTIQMLAGNYFSASIVGLVLFLSYESSAAELELIPIALFVSFLFVGSIFAFSKSVILSGAALSTVSSRLSVFVPIILSMIFYGEVPNLFQFSGLVFTIATITLFYLSIKEPADIKVQRNRIFYLLSVLAGIGIADFFMKVFQQNWGSSDKPWFLFWIFLFSFLITFILSAKQKNKFDTKAIILGLIMGIPNIFSSYFLIEALKSYPAVFVYPVVNLSIIILTSLIVKIIWNEYWNNYSKIALLLGIISIILLSFRY